MFRPLFFCHFQGGFQQKKYNNGQLYRRCPIIQLYNCTTVQLYNYVLNQPLIIFLCRIPPGRWSKKAETCRRFTIPCISLYQSISVVVQCAILYLTDRRRSDALVFLKVITAIFVQLPSSNVRLPRHAAYDGTLVEHRAERWAEAYRSSRKKEHPIRTYDDIFSVSSVYVFYAL